jgi:hypothetical protein
MRSNDCQVRRIGDKEKSTILQTELENQRARARFRRLMMKTMISKWMAAILFAGTLGLASAQAASSPASYKKPVELTGCLEQGPIAKEYLLRTNDGKTWAVTSADRDMYMNNYAGQMVTVAGDREHLTTTMKTASIDNQPITVVGHLRAMDLTVDSETCQK